jgi:hypothetical protein
VAVAFSVAAVGVAALATFLIVGSSGHSPVSSRARTARPMEAASEPPSSARLASPASAVASVGVVQTQSKQVERTLEAWHKGRGGVELSALATQVGATAQMVGMRLYAPARSECLALASDVKAVSKAPPIPDTRMERLYVSAVAELGQGASQCEKAISVQPEGDEGQIAAVNRPALSRSVAEMTTGAKELYAATAEINSLGLR